MIENRETLLDNARSAKSKKTRRLILEGVEHALKTASPKKFLRKHLSVKSGKFTVDNTEFNLRKFKKVYVIGAGKASGYLAEEIEKMLGKKVTVGYMNVLRGTKNFFGTSRIKLNEAGHPIPDQDGLKGTEKITELAEEADQSDLVICLLSGGGSSLLPLPQEGITLDAIRLVTEKLILSGATIQEINAVRKHLSKIKGGGLAKKVCPATLISLIISDVVGDPLDVIASGPTSPDSSTYKDAVYILRRYRIWEKSPKSVKELLIKGVEGKLPETPKPHNPYFKDVYNYIIGSNLEICLELKDFYLKKGFESVLFTSRLEGEARDAGTFLSSICKEIVSSGNPLKIPCVLICGGETTVSVKGNGKGGRNQEIALAASIKLDGYDGVALTSFGTDGIDGPTDAAGAIIDGYSYIRGREKGIKAEKYLLNNDSYNFFKKLDDLIICGPTGTNVNDISIAVLLP